MKRLLLTMILLASGMMAWGQGGTTGIQGKVVDAVSGEPLPFVQVGFVGSTIGTSTDMDGRFKVVNSDGHTVVRFQMMGYETQQITIEEGRVKNNVRIELRPHATQLQPVEVKASRRDSRRYRRRDNPAVELAKEVIAHKQQNRPESKERFRRDIYEKTTLALDNFHPDFEHKRLWRKLNFLEKYIDLTPFDDTPILTVSMRESMMTESFRQKPRQKRTLIKAYRMDGIDQSMDQEGIETSLEEMFSPIDIYDNDIELMMNHFVSPLSSPLAVTFYKFYITDTTEVDGYPCVELSFVPTNKQSYGFTGQLYIALDSSYSVIGYSMSVSPHVNMNFVRGLTVVQEFSHDSSGLFLPTRCDTYGRLYINKHIQEVYVHQMRLNYNYCIGNDVELLPDSLFTPLSHTASLPSTKMLRREWNAKRPIQLTVKETMIDSLRFELARLPEVQTLKRIAEATVTGYIPTNKNRDSSRFDIGPIYNFISQNCEEGWRLRIGGMTTAVLSPRNFAEGYVAYGFGDQRAKFNATLTHSFDDKKRHSHESPFNQLSFTASYDIETPGQSFDSYDRDNIMMSSSTPRKAQYVAQAALRYQRQWRSNIGIDTWIAARQYEPAGILEYQVYGDDGTLHTLERFGEAEWMGKLSFTPTRTADNKRPGSANLLTVNPELPTITLTHRVAVMDGGFLYQRTDFAADKRFWIGAFGHIDAKLRAGMVWGRAPYPRLYIPTGNDNLILSSSAFNTMMPMEFIADQYISLFATYHLKGWILNRVPLINRLRLREVVGFNILYGGLSADNNPAAGNPTGLMKMPEGTRPLGDEPYMEYSIGLENILKFIRIDYVRRLSYTDGWNSRQKGFIRIDLRFTL